MREVNLGLAFLGIQGRQVYGVGVDNSERGLEELWHASLSSLLDALQRNI